MLQIVMDTLPVAIFWKDKDLRFLGCNQTIARVMGLDSPAEVVGKDDYDGPWTREEAEFFRSCDRRIMAKGEPEFGIVEPQLQSDGKHAWLETNKAPLFDDAGEVIGILGTFQDITERKQAEIQLQELNQKLAQQADELKDLYQSLEHKVAERTAALNHANQQLKVEVAERQASEIRLQKALHDLKSAQSQLIHQEKMSSLGQMVAGIAHEINNPISFIYGNLTHVREFAEDLLSLIGLYQKYYPDAVPEITAALDAIDLPFIQTDFDKILNSMKTGSVRIRDIILSLRSFALLGEANLKITNIHRGIDSVLTLLQNRLRDEHPSSQINIIREFGQLPPIECYASQLNQVFFSVINNAIDALVEASSHPEYDADTSPCIVISTAITPDQMVQIQVTDNGIGIPPEVQQQIFDPFFTTKPVGQGTGLGLSVSYSIITEAHQGRMLCESTPFSGTTLTIEIPCVQTLRLPTTNSTPPQEN